MSDEIASYYDTHLYAATTEQYYDHSDFSNFGFWDASTSNAREASGNLTDKLLAFIPDKTGTILDVACGKGATTRHLLACYSPAQVTGLNVSLKQLATARENARGCSFVLADAVSLCYRDASFDNMICVEAAFHFRTRERFLKAAHRVLKPGGRLVLSDVLMAEGVEKRMNSFHEENYLPDIDAYRALCHRAGFDRIDVVDATEPCWEGHYRNMVRFIHAKYLAGEVDLDGLKAFLAVTYRLTSDLSTYLLASLRRD